MFKRGDAVKIPAFLGDANGLVKADNDNNVYVILFDGQVQIVKNNRVPRLARMPVFIGKVGDNDYYEVLSPRNVYASQPYINIPNHADQTHTWPGIDVVWVRGEQFFPRTCASIQWNDDCSLWLYLLYVWLAFSTQPRH